MERKNDLRKAKTKNMKYFIPLYFLIVPIISFSQNKELNIFHITSAYTSFPDTARANGHIYDKVLYDAANHYMDSSVMIVVPKKLKTNKKVDLIFWFHGWGNNIDSAAVRYGLLKQFAASGINAVLVFAETTKDAPDSYGGKLEYKNIFKELVNDVIQKLKKEKSISKKCKPGKIILAGHSGAYRVMAYILQNGNMPVQEIILFDALYSETDKYLNWLQSDKKHRFIDIYTDSGGTDDESKEMITQLRLLNIYADSIEEKELTPQLIRKQKIIFIHSLHKHNDIISNPDNFQLFLENTTFMKKIK